MHVSQVMSTTIHSIGPDSTLAEAARLMADHDIGILPVVTSKEPLGMLTDRDIVVRAVGEGRDPSQTQVRDVMTLGVATVADYQNAEDAARLMSEQQVRRVLVVDRDNCCVGIVSLGDLAVRMENEEVSADALEKISE
ncbi:MAG: CBS domain-containing protein [Planctomycetales bacterium]|nr:CBS domain-containing protein [Planctomycetales bacterium]